VGRASVSDVTAHETHERPWPGAAAVRPAASVSPIVPAVATAAWWSAC